MILSYTPGSIILLALAYLTVIVKWYTKIADENQPVVKQLKDRIGKLTDGIESKTKLARSTRFRVEDAKVKVSALEREIQLPESSHGGVAAGRATGEGALQERVQEEELTCSWRS